MLVNKKNQRKRDAVAQGLRHRAEDKQKQCSSDHCLFSLFVFHRKCKNNLICKDQNTKPLLFSARVIRVSLHCGSVEALYLEESLAQRSQMNLGRE